MVNSKPPRHLSADSRAIWTKIVEGWEVDEAGRVILRVALEALDRLGQARAAIARGGLMVGNGKGRGRPHPALAVEKEARVGFLRAWRALNLDAEPPLPIGRPTRRE